MFLSKHEEQMNSNNINLRSGRLDNLEEVGQQILYLVCACNGLALLAQVRASSGISDSVYKTELISRWRAINPSQQLIS